MSEDLWGVWAVRTTGSILGPAGAWLKEGRGPWRGTKEEAREKARKLNAKTRTPNVNYRPLRVGDKD